MYDLTNPQTVKELLNQERVTPRRRMGQHFLTCADVVEATLLSLADMPRRITELGSGIGTLTQSLLVSGFFVRALEKDERLINLFHTVMPEFARDRLELVPGDLRTAPWEWNDPYCLVGNIPYNLSGLIIRRLVTLQHPPDCAVLLVQKEVGERMMAVPPSLNLLALAIQLWGSCRRLRHVPRSCFFPQPNVASQLVRIVPHHARTLQQREAILAVARAFFQHKRKQVGGTLARLLMISRAQALKQLVPLDIDPLSRPQELDLSRWEALARLFPA